MRQPGRSLDLALAPGASPTWTAKPLPDRNRAGAQTWRWSRPRRTEWRDPEDLRRPAAQAETARLCGRSAQSEVFWTQASTTWTRVGARVIIRAEGASHHARQPD